MRAIKPAAAVLWATFVGVEGSVGAHAQSQSAPQGHPIAEYALGWCYEDGRVARDLKTAADWYTKAAAQGVPGAKRRLAKLHQ